MRARKCLAAMLIPLGAVSLGITQIAVHPVAASAGTRPVEPGTAAAGANLLGLSPGVSGLNLTTTFGESTAALEHTESQAKSATVDLGSLGLVLATSTLCGHADLPSKDQPQPLTANSESGTGTTSKSTDAVGRETVTVQRSPESSSATTTMLSESVPGVLSVSGTSTATVRYVHDAAQVASSRVTEDVSLLGGKVRLQGMSWRADRTAGQTHSSTTAFSYGNVVIDGVPLKSPGSPAAAIVAVNKVLGPLGFSLLTPVQSTNNRTGAVTIGPLTLRFQGSAIDRTVLSPAVNAVIDLEDLLQSKSTPGDNCADYRQLLYNIGANVDTLLNVVLEISEGAGALDFDFGGASASARNAAAYADPFGGGSGGAGGAVGASRRSPGSAAVDQPPPATTNVPPPAAGSTGRTGVPQVAAPLGSTLSASAVKCVSTSPAGPGKCWRGVATLASGGALVVGVGLLALDYYLPRRSRPRLRRRYPRV